MSSSYLWFDVPDNLAQSNRITIGSANIPCTSHPYLYELTTGTYPIHICSGNADESEWSADLTFHSDCKFKIRFTTDSDGNITGVYSSEHSMTRTELQWAPIRAKKIYP